MLRRCRRFPVRLTFATTVKPRGQLATSGAHIKAVRPGVDAASLRTTSVVWLFTFQRVLAFTHVVGGVVQRMVSG